MDANWVYDAPGMLKVGPNRNYMLTTIRGIDPGDMPDFDAALNVAYGGLTSTHAYLKHCIILSDGDPAPPEPDLVKKFNDARITVSTVVIQPHDPSGAQNMWEIAKEHGGRFYSVRSPDEIPNIFLKEAATISRSAIIEDPFVPQITADSTIIKGLSATPPLLGYVGTSVKPTALQILRAPKEDDPVLATWQYGLGKSVAFTSDDRQRWAAGWLPWTGYSKFWSQAIRWSMRGATSGDLQTNVNIDRGRGQLTVEAVDSKGNFINFLDTKARLVTPDFKGQDLELEQTGPGRYEGDFDARQLGTYIINLRTGSGDNVSSQVTGAVVPYSPEYADVQSNDPLLASIAERTSGDTLLLPDDPAGDEKLAEQIFHRVREAARLPVDIWLTMLILAACLFPLDVAVRRLMWGEEELNHFAAYLKTIRPKRGAPKPKTQGPARRDETMGRLLKTKGSGSTGGSAMAPPPASGGAPAAPSAPGGTRRPSAGPPASAAPPPAKPATGPSEPRAEESEADLDPMERLRRAKRRARGEE